MNRWAKIVWTLATLGTAGWVGVGLHGYRVADQPTLGLHTLGAFAALLVLLLAHGWMAIFALASRRLVARAAGGAPPALARACRATLFAGVLAMAAAGAQFWLSNALYPARLVARDHALAAAGSIVVLLAALVVEALALGAHARTVERLDRVASAC
jgi:hypothetical protein